jgi:hypothetical protein
MRFARDLYWTYFALIKMGDHQTGGLGEEGGKGKHRDLPSYCRFIVCTGEGRRRYKRKRCLEINKKVGGLISIHLT